MTRNLKYAAFVATGMMVAGCLGQYDMGQQPTTQNPPMTGGPTDPPVTDPPPTTPPPVTPPPTNAPPPPVTGSTAKPLFEMNVKPILMAATGGCTGGACHTAPGASPIRFVSVNAADLYDTVLSYSDKLVAQNFDKTKAQVLTKIAGGHYTAIYTPANVASIQNWLDEEVKARMGGTPTPNVRRQLLSQFSGCMKLTDWQTEGVAPAWANKGTNEGNCVQCHVQGQAFFLATAQQNGQRMFDILSKEKDSKTGAQWMEQFFIPDLTTDPAKPKIIINRGALIRASTGNAQHPTFGIGVNDNAMVRLTNFYNKAMAHLAANTCDMPKFAP